MSSSTSSFVICETVAAITTHLRVVTSKQPINWSGHRRGVHTLCGADAAWDTRLPVQDGEFAARCRDCMAAAAELEERGTDCLWTCRSHVFRAQFTSPSGGH